MQTNDDMTSIVVMSDSVLPLAEIKKRLSEIIDGVEGRHDRVVLTRYGRPAAVIMRRRARITGGDVGPPL